MALFLTGAALLAKSISGPLHAIAVETEHLRRFDFSERPLPDTVFEEIADVNGVFGSLKSGLRGFGKYVPLKLVQELLADGTEPVLGGRSEELSILFSDIHGFTGFSEEIGVADTAQVLGDYLAGIAGIVADESGTVDKYIGDGMMAFWNAPRPVADHAERAVIAAIRCRDLIATMPQANRLRTRFGIHTDRVIVGNFGAPDRFDYTAIGDGVNLAARLERVNNESGLNLSLRAGIDTGKVSSGLLGEPSPVFDMWGIAVNMAHRMKNGMPEPGVYVTTRVYHALAETMSFTPAGTIAADGEEVPVWRVQEPIS
jgi:adenylate cyclase